MESDVTSDNCVDKTTNNQTVLLMTKYKDKTENIETVAEMYGSCDEVNSEIKDSFKNETLPELVPQKANDTCEEALCNDKDENIQPSPCIDTGTKDTNENLSCRSTKPTDPFDLSSGELSQGNFQPAKRNLSQVNDDFEETLSQMSEDNNLPLLSCLHTDVREDVKNKEAQSSAKSHDPFDLSPEDEQSQTRYQPIKRKLCSGNNNSSKLNKDTARICEPAAEISEATHETEAADVLQNVPDGKRLKTSYRVAYVHSQELLEETNKLIRIEGRAELVHSLIQAFGLLRYLEVISPRLASDVEISGFHCPDYINFLHDVSSSDDVDDNSNPACKDAENYGLSYDCPPQKGLYKACCLISGATIVAAERLISDAADVAINWYGGWHHAKRDSASGFCYINDIVLGILKLREKFDRILYVDIDLHHGDGVEEAFCMTPKVMTVSFHKYVSGFFPGSGSLEDVGTGKGKFYSVNVPLLDGIKDAEFCAVFYSVMKLVREKFQPQVIVMQCGADSLSSDPMASFNLTHLGIYKCVALMLSWNLPTLLLGGGGYNFPNTAKCWTFLTSLAVGKKLPIDIPEHDHLLAYGPDFEMSTTAGNRKDCNTKQYLANLVAKISRNLSNLGNSSL